MTYSKNDWLTLEEMTVNAEYILSYLVGRGWTKNAVCGMLGNMQTESSINPGIWQNLDEGNTSLGYGLVQWTPSTKVTNWLSANGYPMGSMDGELERIQYEIDNGLQWISTSSFPMTFQEFKTSTQTPEYLAHAFISNYERPADPDQPIRQTQARYWFDHLTGEGGSGECIQLAVLPIDILHITQGEDGTFSHQNRWALDLVGTSSHYPYYAPCDGECIGRNDTEAILMWKSKGQVMCADGVTRNIIWRNIHDENMLFQVGDTISKGQLMGHTGNGGNSAGDHLHLDVFNGTQYVDPYTNKLHVYDVFAINGVTVVDDLGYPFKTSDYVDCSNTGGGGGNESSKNNLVTLLLCDALNGWKF